RAPLAVSLGLLMILAVSVVPAGAVNDGGVAASARSASTVPASVESPARSPVTSVVAQATPRAAEPAMTGALPESYPWVRLAEKLTPAVVNVRTTGEARRMRTPQVPEPFRRFFPQIPEGGGEREARPRGLGSGFIIEADGYIVTNHH